MSNKVANSIFSGVLKGSRFVTSTVLNSKPASTVLNSKPAQKFSKFSEVTRVSLDGFGKVRDAVDMSVKNVMQTSSVVTTSVVTHRYGDQAGEVTHDCLHAAGNALGAVLKIRNALDPQEMLLHGLSSRFGKHSTQRAI